jgi:hypothetical protein
MELKVFSFHFIRLLVLFFVYLFFQHEQVLMVGLLNIIMCLHTCVYLDKCSLDHLDGCFVTSSQDTAIELWKFFPTLPNCTCNEVLQRKGVGVG